MARVPINPSIMSRAEVRQLNSLVLAYVGDSVQQLMIRAELAGETTAKAGELHRLASLRIKASAQAADMDRIMPYLDEEELDVYKRARNSKMNTMAKNASCADYKKASGFEAVIGYLYLLGRQDRLEYLLCGIIKEEEGK